jgi:membrane-bound ClpP family serine protease
MPSARRIDPIKAATAAAMADGGYGAAQIARATGLVPSSVRDIIHRHGHWGEIAESSVFALHRRQQSQALEAAGRVLAAQAMAQCAERLPDANAYQACLISSIMIDKTRLLAGESTANVSIANKVELSGLAELAGALSTLAQGLNNKE